MTRREAEVALVGGLAGGIAAFVVWLVVIERQLEHHKVVLGG